MMMMNRRDLNFLSWCVDGAHRFSTCGKRQYQAIVTSLDGRVVGTGYNGSPPGYPHCIDGACPRLTANAPSGSVYNTCISIHAEANALLYSAPDDRRGGTLYVNGTPCWDCGKLIAGSGVRRLVHLEDATYEDWPRVRELLLTTGVSVASLHPDDL